MFLYWRLGGIIYKVHVLNSYLAAPCYIFYYGFMISDLSVHIQQMFWLTFMFVFLASVFLTDSEPLNGFEETVEVNEWRFGLGLLLSRALTVLKHVRIVKNPKTARALII